VLTTVLSPLRRPRRLRQGDRVAVVSPSGPVDPGRLERGCALLGELGLDVVVGAHARDAAGYLAGSDADRAADLQDAWAGPGVRAVFCARGGYGAARLLDLLDWDAMRVPEPPVFVGASDVTSLHLAIARHLGVATLFGPMAAAGILAGEEPEPATLHHLVTTLASPEKAQVLAGGGVRLLARGSAGPIVRGVSTGGTLALLAAAVGTPEAPSCAGGVLFLEDVGEPSYRIDRMLTQLIRAGVLDGVRAVVAGDWDRCGPEREIDAVLRERLGPLGVPVLTGFDFGHGPVQLTIPLGAAMTVDLRAGTVTLDEPALA
jgi:muramoyltetrapeptide carboxypeptidase